MAAMERPLVSIIMPTYNASAFIGESIRSILQQTYDRFELIIINDASNDQTDKVLSRFYDQRIIVLKNEENRGIVYSRNRGMAHSRGKYVAVLDSDDLAMPDRLERQVVFLESHPDYAAVGSHYHVIDTKGLHLASVSVPLEHTDAFTFLLFNVCFCHSTLMMRGDVARAFRYREGFDIIEDYELAYRISRTWKLANIPYHTVMYRIHGNNISKESKSRMLERRLQLDAHILKDSGVPFSSSELSLHSHFINMSDGYFRNPGRIEELERWLQKYYKLISGKPGINRKTLKRIIAIRWVLICVRSGNYQKVLINGLIWTFRLDFMRYNLGYLRDMLSRSLNVV